MHECTTPAARPTAPNTLLLPHIPRGSCSGGVPWAVHRVSHRDAPPPRGRWLPGDISAASLPGAGTRRGRPAVCPVLMRPCVSAVSVSSACKSVAEGVARSRSPHLLCRAGPVVAARAAVHCTTPRRSIAGRWPVPRSRPSVRVARRGRVLRTLRNGRRGWPRQRLRRFADSDRRSGLWTRPRDPRRQGRPDARRAPLRIRRRWATRRRCWTGPVPWSLRRARTASAARATISGHTPVHYPKTHPPLPKQLMGP